MLYDYFLELTLFLSSTFESYVSDTAQEIELQTAEKVTKKVRKSIGKILKLLKVLNKLTVLGSAIFSVNHWPYSIPE